MVHRTLERYEYLACKSIGCNNHFGHETARPSIRTFYVRGLKPKISMCTGVVIVVCRFNGIPHIPHTILFLDRNARGLRRFFGTCRSESPTGANRSQTPLVTFQNSVILTRLRLRKIRAGTLNELDDPPPDKQPVKDNGKTRVKYISAECFISSFRVRSFNNNNNNGHLLLSSLFRRLSSGFSATFYPSTYSIHRTPPTV